MVVAAWWQSERVLCLVVAAGCVVVCRCGVASKSMRVWCFCGSFSGCCWCGVLLLFLGFPLAAASGWGFLSSVAFLFEAFVGGLLVFFSWSAALFKLQQQGLLC